MSLATTRKNIASLARANGLSVQVCVDLYDALKELTEISGEATITLDSAKAVRKMARFVAARERALKVLAEADGDRPRAARRPIRMESSPRHELSLPNLQRLRMPTP
jgi:D-serine deaminase-like pyridoxal phosphate-dependent protein